MDEVNLNLDLIEQELAQISPWPWSEQHQFVADHNDEQICEVLNTEFDKSFIASAPSRIDALVKRVRELEERVMFLEQFEEKYIKLKLGKILDKKMGLKSSDEG